VIIWPDFSAAVEVAYGGCWDYVAGCEGRIDPETLEFHSSSDIREPEHMREYSELIAWAQGSPVVSDWFETLRHTAALVRGDKRGSEAPPIRRAE
jgi:hypothetical protein